MQKLQLLSLARLLGLSLTQNFVCKLSEQRERNDCSRLARFFPDPNREGALWPVLSPARTA